MRKRAELNSALFLIFIDWQIHVLQNLKKLRRKIIMKTSIILQELFPSLTIG